MTVRPSSRPALPPSRPPVRQNLRDRGSPDLPEQAGRGYGQNMGRHEAQPRRLTRRGLQVSAAVLGGLATVGVVAAVVWGGGDPATTPARGPATSATALPLSAGPTSASPPVPSTATASDASSPATSPMAMGPTLEIRAVGTSWVEVRGPADRVLVARIFRKGDRATFSQSRVHVTIGDAGAVRLTANGMPVRDRRPGQVVLMSVVRGGD